MDDATRREIDRLGQQNAETIRRASRAPHPWDEFDVPGDPVRQAVLRERERIWQALGKIGLGESAPWDAISALLDESEPQP